MDLARSQRWLASVIIGDGRGENAGNIDAFVTGGPRMSAADRLDIYHHAYRARLAECLADDYPALQHALGDDVFEQLCHGYIARHPSMSFSLNAFGAKMSGFCREQEQPWNAFAGDLADLEWAIVKAIHAPELRPLGQDALAQVGADDWDRVMLTPAPALTVLATSHPVNAYFGAFRSGEQGAKPARGSIPPRALSGVAVYRDAATVWRQDLAPAAVAILKALMAGASLGEALAPVDATEDQVSAWFRGWMETGFFADLCLGEKDGD